MNSPTSHEPASPDDGARFDSALDCLDEVDAPNPEGFDEAHDASYEHAYAEEDDEYSEDEEPFKPPVTRRRRRARAEAPADMEVPIVHLDAPGGGATMFAGWGMVGAGLAFGALRIAFGTVPALEPLIAIGLNPGMLLVAGIVLVGLGRTRKNQDARLIEISETLIESQAHVTGSLGYLVSAQASGGAGGGGVDAAFVNTMHELIGAVQERVGNIGKAIKMFSKPLVEISNQVSDVSHRSDKVVSTVDGLQTRIDATHEELKEALQAGFEEGLQAASPGLSEDSLKAVTDGHQRALEGLAEQLRSDLDDRSQSLSTTVEHVVSTAREALLTELGNVSKALADANNSSDDVGELDTTLRRVERELSGIATSISRLGAAAPAAAAPVAAAPVAAAPAPAAPAPAPAAAPSSPAPAAGPRADGSGPASSIAGTQRGKGKNVLGAIAKLKQMRD